jgi:N-terminal domain of toast_rack, DUF2154/Cell wall-active antibiotics response 4TMS YvqF
MKKQLFIPLTLLVSAVLACSPANVTINAPRIPTGPTETITVNEPLPDSSAVTDVKIEMGAGKLTLAGGANGLAEGEIRYNVAEWKPTITNTGSSLTIAQGDSNVDGFPGDNVINDWDLKLGDAPMNLTVHAGAYNGLINLSGVPLQNLTINDGASSSEVTFDTLNPEEMDSFEYNSGASSVTLLGLANANFSKMDFNGGAGDYTLDFGGTLQRDAKVTVDGGVGSIKIIVPQGFNAKVSVDTGIGNVDADSDFSQSGDTYTLTGSGPTLTIVVKMGVGSLELETK